MGTKSGARERGTKWVGLIVLSLAALPLSAERLAAQAFVPKEAGSSQAVAATSDLGSGPDGEGLFQRNCAVCHGDEGRGDGPAAAGLRPPPADFTDPERMGDLSLDDMLKAVSGGKGFMPSFEKLLSPEELRAVLRYIRSLSKEKGEQA